MHAVYYSTPTDFYYYEIGVSVRDNYGIYGHSHFLGHICSWICIVAGIMRAGLIQKHKKVGSVCVVHTFSLHVRSE